VLNEVLRHVGDQQTLTLAGCEMLGTSLGRFIPWGKIPRHPIGQDAVFDSRTGLEDILPLTGLDL
jgi:hypothetical protein